MELTQLTNHLKKENSEFLKLDYLYYFEKDGYPLKEDVNLENIYFVIENSKNEKVKARNMGNGNVKEFTLIELAKGNWWFFRIPNFWKR